MLRYSDCTSGGLGLMAKKAEKILLIYYKAICNFFQKSESSKYRKKRFGYPHPYPLPVW